MSAANEACDVLAISPHPDDADLFCGATLASWAAQGRVVRIVDLSRGELATNGSVEERRKESLAAIEALGLHREREVLEFADGEIHRRDPAQLRALVQLLRRLRPRVVVAPWREDRHPDHREASHLARDAFFWSGVSRFDSGADSAVRPGRLLYYPCHGEAPVNLLIDVESGIQAWESAVDCYTSQVGRGEGRPETYLNRREFRSGLRARRRLWGERAGVTWAEGFVTETAIAFSPDAVLGSDSRENGS